jgi:hypothetical protein
MFGMTSAALMAILQQLIKVGVDKRTLATSSLHSLTFGPAGVSC